MPDLTLAHVSALWPLDKCGPGRQTARTAALGPSQAACPGRLPEAAQPGRLPELPA
ncbi:hypothetical protein [Actinomyces graevenitzii]|uniref:hypothetical protein n=1 Tax=Actinomyces graevenitzii TaxID=55565 RepID=UPI0002F79605|nr:hypothetical protein [Actinomyces graevenitzii]